MKIVKVTPKSQEIERICGREVAPSKEIHDKVMDILADINPYLESVASAPLTESKKLSDLASRPELSLADLLQFVPRGTSACHLDVAREDIINAVEIFLKYRGYIERERALAYKMARLEHLPIPADFDFDKVSSLSIECRQKLMRYRPETIAQASRISGVSPADISVLLVYFGR